TAETLASQLCEEQPNAVAFLEERACAKLSLADALLRLDRYDAAAQNFQATFAENENVARRFPDQTWISRHGAETAPRLERSISALVGDNSSQSKWAHQFLPKAIAELKVVNSVLKPDDMQTRMQLADGYMNVIVAIGNAAEWTQEADLAEQGLQAQL